MDATLQRSGTGFTIRFERDLAHTPEKVWRVISERALLTQWFPCDIVGEWKTGAPLRFVFPDEVAGMVAEVDTHGKVLACEVGRLLEFSWGTGSVLRMEIVPNERGCRFVLSDTKSDPGILARDASGWETCLANFASVLETGSAGAFQPGEWRQLFATYTAKFEPEAGPQQGPPADHPALASD